MSFLNPALLYSLLPLLALPLIIHLLNQRHPKPYMFTSVALLKLTEASRSRVQRWRHWLFLLLRTLFLLLLLLAFLLPFLNEDAVSALPDTQRNVLVVVDHSMSMEHLGNNTSARKRAILEGHQIVDTLDSQDLVNVLRVSQAPQSCFVDFSRNQAGAKSYLSATPPAYGHADFNQANALASKLFAGKEGIKEIYFISDFQRQNWSTVDFRLLPADARIFFVDVGGQQRANRAILDVELSDASLLAGSVLQLTIRIGNFSDDPWEDTVEVILDKRLSFKQQAYVSPWTTADIRFAVPLSKAGEVPLRVEIPKDALPMDNAFYLTLPVKEQQEVLVATDGTDDASDSAFFLKTALNPYPDANGSIMPQIISSAEVLSTRLASCSHVFFTKIDSLSKESAQAIAEFVFNGGSLVYFMDGEADPANVLALSASPSGVPLPLTMGSKYEVKNIGAERLKFARGDFQSPFLKLFQGEKRELLSLLDFYDLYLCNATHEAQVLLSYSDETPAMVSVNHGLGTVLFMNFSVSELSSNLARQRLFPVWLHEITQALTPYEDPLTHYRLGQNISFDVWRQEATRGNLINPSGDKVRFDRRPEGERFELSFDAGHVGFYQFSALGGTRFFGVNPSSVESDLRPMDKGSLPDFMQDTHVSDVVSGQRDYAQIVEGKPLYHWFVLAAIGMLLLELLLQRVLRGRTVEP